MSEYPCDVIIHHPSGKTILSSYVAMQSDAKILFVVPTDPLVWQVAAMFHKALQGPLEPSPASSFINRSLL